MPKSTKRFILSNSNLNGHGFRMLTSGADLTDFIVNPIMYWMHAYPTGEKVDEHLPIGYWTDIKIEGDNITAVPVFDDSDPFAMKIYKKVEHGTLRATSAGALPKPGGLSSDPADMVAGQTLPTFKYWWLKECSICDRGSNTGAIVTLFNKTAIVLAAGATTSKMTARQLVTQAYNEGKIQVLEIRDYRKLAEHQFESTANLFETIRPGAVFTKSLLGKSWDQLDSSNELETLKKWEPEIYNNKFKEKFGYAPGGRK